MRLDVSSAVAVTRKGQRSYGTTRWIDGRYLSFSTHGEVEAGDQIELRLALDGLYDTVWAEVEVDRTRRASVGGPLLCDAHLLYVPSTDRRKLDAWIADRSASVSRDRERAAREAAREGATETATERVDVPPGRAAIGHALRTSLGRSGQGRPARRYQPAAEGGVRAVLSKDGATVTMTWASRQELAHTWEHELRRGWLDVPVTTVTPPAGLGMTVRMCLPDGEVVPIAGEVVAETRDGFSVAVRVPEAAAGRIRRAFGG